MVAYYAFSSFPLLLAFVVGGLGFEFFVFIAGWRHALRSEWPFAIIIIITGECLHSFIHSLLLFQSEWPYTSIISIIIIIILLILILCPTHCSPAQANVSYTDAPAQHWAQYTLTNCLLYNNY